jgi:hypothetical protein
MTKKQRRVARTMMLPLVAFVMMTSAMALAGTSHSAPAPITSR